MSDLLLTETRGAVRWLTINRPKAMNQVTWELFPQMITAFQDAQADPAVRAIVLTGAGEKFFCGGGDLASDEERSLRGLAPDWLNHPITRVFDAVERCQVPIVARVNGHALAPGLSLLSMVDLAVATERAMFGIPEAKVGLANTLGLAYLQRLVPQRKLLELMLTAEPVDAREALTLGLVNYVVPAAELDAKLDWLIARLIDKSPEATRRGKLAFKAMRDMTLQQALAYGNAAVGNILLTEDFRGGIRAFHEKRPVDWPARKTEA
ncbi:MAG: enoyl-CoA hydratase/isomerase family protein [Burkholderiales bacterium]|nr:enoyl-CoA hydratase/isomerase family protein [Burkholderiales bacterium]